MGSSRGQSRVFLLMRHGPTTRRVVISGKKSRRVYYPKIADSLVLSYAAGMRMSSPSSDCCHTRNFDGIRRNSFLRIQARNQSMDARIASTDLVQFRGTACKELQASFPPSPLQVTS